MYWLFTSEALIVALGLLLMGVVAVIVTAVRS